MEIESGIVAAGVYLNFSYAAGQAASRFLIALRDEKKIYGTRCEECQRVLVPARSFCPRCFEETREWVEIGPVGTIVAFAPNPTLQPPSLQGKGESSSPPRIGEGLGVGFLALIRLDGAETALVHRLAQVDAETLHIGQRVTAVFAEERHGHILDIAYFRPM